MQEAESIIRSEHRCLAQVLGCIDSLMRDADVTGAPPDLPLLRLAVDYVADFVYAFHHPKETGHLFPALRRRAPCIAADLDALEAEHEQGKALMAELGAALAACEHGEDGGLRRFKRAAAAYRAHERNHMLKEERSILPYAGGCLTEADWGRIDAVFLDYADPVFGARRTQAFQALFDKIVSLGPVRSKPDPAREAPREG